jgi:hypothetical protein
MLQLFFLVQELGYAASKYQILQLSDVWERYCSLVAQTMHEESKGFPFQKSTDEVGVKMYIRH